MFCFKIFSFIYVLDIMDDEEVEITPPMPSGRGRGMRGGPGRRVLKLGVGGFFVRVRFKK